MATGGACTIVLHGSTNLIVDGAEHSLCDALSMLRWSGRPMSFLVADRLQDTCHRHGKMVKGKKAIAVELFVHASWQIAVIISGNATYDSMVTL